MNPETFSLKYIYNYDYNAVTGVADTDIKVYFYPPAAHTIIEYDYDPQPIIVLSNSKLVWRGEWDRTVCYRGHDVVLHERKFWACCTTLCLTTPSEVSSLWIKLEPYDIADLLDGLKLNQKIEHPNPVVNSERRAIKL